MKPEFVGRDIFAALGGQTATSKSETGQPKLIPADLNESERKIWRLLSPDEPTHINILLEQSSLSFGDLNKILFDLEMRDLIRVLPGKYKGK